MKLFEVVTQVKIHVLAESAESAAEFAALSDECFEFEERRPNARLVTRETIDPEYLQSRPWFAEDVPYDVRKVVLEGRTCSDWLLKIEEEEREAQRHAEFLTKQGKLPFE